MSKIADHFLGDTPALARTTDPETSHEAARAMSAHVSSSEQVVLEAIRSCGTRGAINDDLVEKTGLSWNVATPRVKPLRKKKLVKTIPDPENPAKLAKRRGKSGHLQTIWFAT